MQFPTTHSVTHQPESQKQLIHFSKDSKGMNTNSSVSIGRAKNRPPEAVYPAILRSMSTDGKA